ncbi:MAG: hypothetical protein K0S66_3207 [Sphingomonas sp.]|jgi:hypothetical protein|nr:hypothetical protein [Sphingomonas sp.]
MPHPAAIPPFPTHAPISDTSLDAVRHWQALVDARSSAPARPDSTSPPPKRNPPPSPPLPPQTPTSAEN